MRVSDYIARFLVEQGVDLVFTITGAGNVRLIEAVHEAGIRYVCPHHEQAALMAAIARHRIHGTPAVCLVTGGPGAANTLIGLADAHLDSLPLVVIAGQERVGFVDPPNALRGKGVQGLDMVHMVSTVTKYAACLTRPTDLRHLLERAFHEATTGRPGPVWVEVPQDLQWASVEPDALLGLTPPVIAAATDMSAAASAMLALVAEARRPLVWVGHGIRLGRCEALFHRVFDALGIPALVSWQGADLIPDDHPLYVGRAGVYGQRWANFALQTCDLLITLGTRLALPQRGYVDAEFAPGARKVIVEIDPAELDKFTFPVDLPVLGDVAEFLAAVDSQLSAAPSTGPRFPAWITQCHDWRDRYPMSVAPAETDEVTAGINSYWFIERLSAALPSDAIVVTDMGTSLTCTHATIRLQAGQRLLTSTGLGEMGFGLPGAIGAALGAPGRCVVLIAGEGSLMMNLQELQTLRHLSLPVTVFLLNNNGYLTIQHTHHALFGSGGTASATGPSTGVSFPDFAGVAAAFDLTFRRTAAADGLDAWLRDVLALPGRVLAEVVMPTFQELVPKSSLKVRPDGSVYSPPLEDLYPFLPPEQLRRELDRAMALR